MSFGLARFDLTTLTRSLELPEISADPAAPLTLIVRYCGPGNRLWENHQFEAPGDAPAEGTPERTAWDRERTSGVVAATSIAGWQNVLDDDAPVECMPDAARRFLGELEAHCPDVWRRVLNYVGDKGNFRAPRVDPVDLGKG